MKQALRTDRATQPSAITLMFALGAILCGCGVGDVPGTIDALQPVAASASHSVKSWKLPKPLREISGLASDATGLVYAVADERATIFVLNPESGETMSVFGLGNPPVKGDFEGIALHGNWLYVISSDGRLLRTIIATHANDEDAGGTLNHHLDGSSRQFETFELPTGCKEIEGLASDPVVARLWLVCKEIQTGATVIRLEAWSVDLQRLLPEAGFELPVGGVLALTGQEKFKPSGIAFVPAAGVGSRDRSEASAKQTNDVVDLLIISGAQRAYSRWRWPSDAHSGQSQAAESSSRAAPQLHSAGRLSAAHRQPEGVAAGASGTLLIADEGAGKRGRLRVYPKGALQ